MPKSLRNKIKHLAYKGELNERERDRILNALDREAKWIPVSERLPKIGEYVLVTDGRGMYVGWIDSTDKHWRIDDYFRNEIIAWMPLPQPYKRPKMMCEED